MAEKPEWAARRNVGGEWFAHTSAGGASSNEKLRFSKKCYDGQDEFKKWDYLKDTSDPTPAWQIERGGSKWTKPGRMPRRRKKEAIRPDEQRLRDEIRKEKLRERTLETRRVELAHNERPHAYKDIISWEEDRLLAASPKHPIREQRPLLKQNREGRVERMTKETAAEMRSSKNRFFCEPVVDPARQAKLQNGGLYKPRKASVLGNSTDSKNTIKSYGVADALTHSVYGGKALDPEWDLEPVQLGSGGDGQGGAWNQPQWFGQESHVRSEKPAKQPPAPKWWPKNTESSSS